MLKLTTLWLNKPLTKVFVVVGLLVVVGVSVAINQQYLAFDGKPPTNKNGNVSFQSTITYFVKTDGSDTSDCLSWNTACKTVTNAIYKIPSQTTDFYNIFVKEGTYKYVPPPNDPNDIAVITQSVIKNNYAIYGGFQGTETNPSQRPKNHSAVSYIDGENTRKGINLTGDNITLDRLTVKNGLADVRNGIITNPRGGGAEFRVSNLTVNDLTIRDSKAIFNPNGSQTSSQNGSGGCLAVSPNGTNLTINRLKLDSCQADKNGGGMYVDAFGQAMQSISITNSTAAKGGGIYSYYPLRFEDVSLIGNSAQMGGGLYIANQVNNDLTSDRMLFLNNHADQGSSIFVDRPASQPYRIINSIFLKNSGSEAPIEVNDPISVPTFGVYGATFSDNVSSLGNGAIHYRSNSQPWKPNSIISYNTSPKTAIGMDVARTYYDGNGYDVYFGNLGGDYDQNTAILGEGGSLKIDPTYINRVFTSDPLSFALDRPTGGYPWQGMADRGYCGSFGYYCSSLFPDFFGAKRVYGSYDNYQEGQGADYGAIEYQWAQTYARLDRFQGPGHDGNQQYRKIHLKAFSDSGMTNLLDEDDLPTASDGYFVLRGRGRWNADRPDLAVDSNLFAKDVGPRTFCLTAYGYTSKKITVPTMLRTNAPGFNLTLTGIGNTSTVAGSEDTVNINDLNNVLINFTKTRSQPPDYNQDLPGDANGDDTVDLFDLNAVLTNFGSQGEC